MKSLEDEKSFDGLVIALDPGHIGGVVKNGKEAFSDWG